MTGSADILLPTVEDCEAVESHLANWENLTMVEREKAAETGRECNESYPLLYPEGCEPDTAGACCAVFGLVTTACVQALPDVLELYSGDGSHCGGTRPSMSHFCWRMYDQGEGWSDVRGTEGYVAAAGHKTPKCDWQNWQTPYCKTEKESTDNWDIRKKDCHQTTASLVVVVTGGDQGPAIPSGGATDTNTVDCD